MAFTNDTSAHTSYLFIFKERFLPDRISQISPAQKCCGVSLSVIAAPVDSQIKNLHPGAGAGRLLYANRIHSQRFFSGNFPKFRAAPVTGERAL